MKTATGTEDTPWVDVLRIGELEEVVVMREGHAVALVIPFDDEDLEWYARERAPEFIASIAKARRQVERGGTVGHEELVRELGLN